jgi:catechol 2,3-dioxygenase-like lactoylglutathione lyase family enzyme
LKINSKKITICELEVKVSLHHAHLFASDLEKSLNFYTEMFGAVKLFDLEMAGARNVMVAIGSVKINFYDQPPKDKFRGVVHHLGIETDDIERLVAHMENKGYKFKNQIKNLGIWKYIMVEGPDHVLLELFEINKDKTPSTDYLKISNFELK